MCMPVFSKQKSHEKPQVEGTPLPGVHVPQDPGRRGGRWQWTCLPRPALPPPSPPTPDPDNSEALGNRDPPTDSRRETGLGIHVTHQEHC